MVRVRLALCRRRGAALIALLAHLFTLVFAFAYGSAADEALVRQALGGHRGALRLLVRRLVPVIRARVAAYLGRRGGRLGARDVDDVTQDIWLKLLEGDGHLLRAYDAERGKSLEGYVGLVCRRELWRRARALGAERRGGGQDDAPLEAATAAAHGDPDPEAQLVGRDLLDGLQRHLRESLPERGRLVLALVYEDQTSPQDAAEVMGVNTQVVYNWMHRIRALTREFLDGGPG